MKKIQKLLIKNKRKKVIYTLFLCIFLAIIFYLSNQNGQQSNKISMKISEVVEKNFMKNLFPIYLKLERKNDVFSGYYSSDGNKWSKVGKDTQFTLNKNIYLGMAVASHNIKVSCTAIFSDTKIYTKKNEISKEWMTTDIGKNSKPGSMELVNGTYLLNSSGSDIWRGPNQLHFTYQQVTGDCTIITKLNSISYSDEWAKAGVIMRDNLDPNADFIDIIVTPGKIVSLQWRDKAVPHLEYVDKSKKNINKIVRKIFHFTEFLILFFLISNLLRSLSAKYLVGFVFSFILCVIFAFLDEFHQIFIKGRTSLLMDVFIDTSGALVALVIITLIYITPKKEDSK